MVNDFLKGNLWVDAKGFIEKLTAAMHSSTEWKRIHASHWIICSLVRSDRTLLKYNNERVHNTDAGVYV